MRVTTVRLYQFAVIAAAAVLLSDVFWKDTSLFHPNTLLLLLLGILVESIQIPVGRAHGTLMFGVVMGTMILNGPEVAALITSLAVLLEPLLQRKKKHAREALIYWFNASQYVISTFVAHDVYLWLGAVDDPLVLVSSMHVLKLVPVAAAFMITNHLLVYLLFWIRRDQLTARDYLKLSMSDSLNYLISAPYAVMMLAFSRYILVILLASLPLLLFGQVLKLYRRISQLSRVNEVTQRLQSEFDLEKIYTEIVESAAGLTSSGGAALWVLRDGSLYPVAASDSLMWLLPQEGVPLTGPGVAYDAVRNRQAELVNEAIKELRLLQVTGRTDYESFLVVPLLARHKVLGVIACYGRRTYAFSGTEVDMLTVLAAQVGVFIENANLYMELQEATLRDPGTGLYNYRYFYQELSRRFAQAKADAQPLSIVIIDIDHFKKYNDTYGHVVGDEVLRQTGQVIQRTVGEGGIVARYGGEEFAVILDTGLAEAQQTVEQIRSRVAGNTFAYQGYVVQGVTISVGVASYPDHDQDEKELLEKADQAMYWGAKQRGRNKAAVYTPDLDAHLFVDKLTGLYTYHYLHVKMMEEFLSGHREQQQLFCLIFLDLVDFDNINRTFGFEAGNAVLREVSVLIKQSVRTTEIASRYSGDEFLLLIPGVEQVEAEKICDRIVKVISGHPFRVRENIIMRVLVRSAVTAYPEDVADAQHLMSHIPQTFLSLSSKFQQQHQPQDA